MTIFRVETTKFDVLSAVLLRLSLPGWWEVSAGKYFSDVSEERNTFSDIPRTV